MPWKDILDSNGRIIVDSKHGSLQDLLEHELLLPEKAERLFKFCAVRNPFDSLVSLYTKHRTTYAGSRRIRSRSSTRNPARSTTSSGRKACRSATG